MIVTGIIHAFSLMHDETETYVFFIFTNKTNIEIFKWNFPKEL